MNRFIVVNNDTSNYIPVEDIYAYTYDTGSGVTVLRLYVKEDIMNFEAIKNLLTSDNIIDYYEKIESDGTNPERYEFRLRFEHFCNSFKSTYSADEGVWFAEVAKKTDAELLVEQNSADTMVAYEAIAALYETENA